jgi:lysophospholipase L1-like esterase
LVFGASVTQGFWDAKGGWVQRLWHHYLTQYLSDQQSRYVTIFNLGISGDSTRELLKRLENETIARKWPGEEFTFIISIGINDSFIRDKNNENMSLEEYRGNLENIIKIAKRYSKKVLLVGLQYCDEKLTDPTLWDSRISYRNDRIKKFDAQVHKTALEQGVSYLPIFEEFKSRHEQGEDLYTDGLHPNDAGHQLIFELVRPALDQLLAGG